MREGGHGSQDSSPTTDDSPYNIYIYICIYIHTHIFIPSSLEIKNNIEATMRMLYFLVVVSFIAIQVVAAETFPWKQLNTTGTKPSNRYGHTSVVWNDMMVVFGGRDRLNVSPYTKFDKNDVWSLNLTTLEWTCLSAATTITYTKKKYWCMLFLHINIE